nr:prolyl oligopeptidase family serine peptidase [Derxia gummosa]
MTDPFLHLEAVDSPEALAWVRERNALTEAELTADPRYARIRAELLRVMNSPDRIPDVTRRGAFFYNFWRDEQHKRGLWRRTSFDDWRQPQPTWETVLDLDALGAAEGENWVWAGASALGPDYRRCLVHLSRGGADATVIREFDLVEKRFVEGGFALPEAKSDIEWIDENTVFVGTDFGPGSLTRSGYVRVIKRWKRGTPLDAAETVFEGDEEDVSVGVMVDRTPGWERTIFTRSLDFYREETWLELRVDGANPAAADDGAPAGVTGQAAGVTATKRASVSGLDVPAGRAPGRRVKLDLPDDASADFWERTLLVTLRSDWELADSRYLAGSLLAIDADAFLAGARDFTILFTPTDTRSLDDYDTTATHLLMTVLDNVAGRLEAWHRHDDGTWTRREIEAPHPGTLDLGSLHDPEIADDPFSERWLLDYTDFLTPDSLWLCSTANDERELLKRSPQWFDAEGMRVEQLFATSEDGTQVPYFVVWPKGATADGANPTLLYGYGGFEISLAPEYAPDRGLVWHKDGGVFVVANIRGGGEFGPEWHEAAVEEGKQASYDDFIAVAEDLIARGITSPRHLGIMGGSNGGLLVGAVMVQRPDLFNAVVCQVPLLDMKRYHLLLAGASWMAEYGNPDDPEHWEFIADYSPYHNVEPDAVYPRPLFTTSTRDDRVHPGHARKMAALMLSQGHDLLYFENTEGGHGGAADNEQHAHLGALEYVYLWQRLGRVLSAG